VLLRILSEHMGSVKAWIKYILYFGAVVKGGSKQAKCFAAMLGSLPDMDAVAAEFSALIATYKPSQTS
jgi:hypothetical protein